MPRTPWRPREPAARQAPPPDPAPTLLSSQNARLAAARRLTRRRGRSAAGQFLAEGAQAVREALRADAVLDLFATAEAIQRHPDLTADAAEISAKDAASLSETVTPQGLVAVCPIPTTTAADLFAAAPRLLAVVVEPNDPGNLGTVIRTADAAGADGVIVDGGVDPYNGKAVRASAGSLFHLPVVPCAAEDLLAHTGRGGMVALAATGRGSVVLDDLISAGSLAGPTIWLFGSEAHGLPAAVLEAADQQVQIPIYGRAESLNLATAAAVALYASAHAQRV